MRLTATATLPLGALLFGIATMPASAQDRPALLPSRDVTVTYRIVGEPQAPGGAQVRFAWRAAGRTARFDNPDNSWLVIDLGGNRGFMVADAQREMMQLPPPPAGDSLPGLLPPDGRFTRGATERIANTACTAWQVALPDGSRGRACVTDDGVVLRSVGSAPGQPEQGLEATAITYGPQDQARFQAPAGYRVVQPPAEPPAGARPPAPPAAPPARPAR